MLELKELFRPKDEFKFEEKLRKNFKIHPEEKVFFRDNSPINKLKNAHIETLTQHLLKKIEEKSEVYMSPKQKQNIL